MEKRILFGLAAALVQAAGVAWAADFTVINTNNAGPGSLRQAILDANATVERDRVRFDIPGENVRSIRVTTSLPEITDSIEIDGYSQTDSRPNTLVSADDARRLIEVNGVDRNPGGIVIRGAGSTIRGLIVRNFNTGLTLLSASNQIVGNLIGSDESPPFLGGGTFPIGSGNGVGIQIENSTNGSACCSTVGGLLPSDHNVIAGNNGSAVRMGERAGTVHDCQILGNFIGVKSSGDAFSLQAGSSLISVRGAQRLLIGGLEPGARNIFAHWAISIYGESSSVQVIGNYFGVSGDGSTPLAPGPLLLPYSTHAVRFYAGGRKMNCLIAWNRIGYQTLGVDLMGDTPFPPEIDPIRTTAVTISSNAIFSSRNYGIYLSLGARTNDFLDLDFGANDRQNFPEIQSVEYVGGNTIISGVLNSAPLSNYRIEIFANSFIFPSGQSEGEFFLASTNLTTDFNGAAPYEVTFPGVLATKPFITATATDVDGNTSMFSRPVHGLSPDQPLFHLHPASATVLPYTNLLFTTDVTGAAPLALQWTKDGVPIAGATNLSLSLSNIVWEDRGSYVLVASNAFGVVSSETAAVTVIAQPTVLVQPVGALVNPGTNFTFSVQAGGMLPIAYQWLWNGVAIPGATGASLTLTNVDWPMRGDYAVVMSNAFGVTWSDVVTLAVKIRPVIIQQPLSQAVVSNGFVTLSVVVSNSATAPLTYLWRSNSLVVRAETTTNYMATLTVGPVRTNGAYTLQITNAFSVAGVLGSRVNLTVLTDTDGDGLPDGYEDAYGLNSSEPADAALDLDGDGVSNGEEYQAGTDPSDSANQLRVERIGSGDGAAWLEFQTRSNRTYVVEARPAMEQGAWSPWVMVPARSTNGLERLNDPAPGARKFYRLKTPAGD